MNLWLCSSASITAGMIAGTCAVVEHAESTAVETFWKAEQDTVAVLRGFREFHRMQLASGSSQRSNHDADILKNCIASSAVCQRLRGTADSKDAPPRGPTAPVELVSLSVGCCEWLQAHVWPSNPGRSFTHNVLELEGKKHAPARPPLR